MNKFLISLLLISSPTGLILSAAQAADRIRLEVDEVDAKELNWKLYELIQTAEGLVQGFQVGAISIVQIEKEIQALDFDFIESTDFRAKLKHEIFASFLQAKNIRLIRAVNNYIADPSYRLTSDEKKIVLGQLKLSTPNEELVTSNVLNKLKTFLNSSYNILRERGGVWNSQIGAWQFPSTLLSAITSSSADFALEMAATQQYLLEVLRPRSYSILMGPQAYEPSNELPSDASSPLMSSQNSGTSCGGTTPTNSRPVLQRSGFNSFWSMPISDLQAKIQEHEANARAFMHQVHSIQDQAFFENSWYSEWLRSNIIGSDEAPEFQRQADYHLSRASLLSQIYRARLKTEVPASTRQVAEMNLSLSTRDTYQQISRDLERFDQNVQAREGAARIALAVTITIATAGLGGTAAGSGLLVRGGLVAQGSFAARALTVAGSSAQGARHMLLLATGVELGRAAVVASIMKASFPNSVNFSELLNDQLNRSMINLGSWEAIGVMAALGGGGTIIGGAFGAFGASQATAAMITSIVNHTMFAGVFGLVLSTHTWNELKAIPKILEAIENARNDAEAQAGYQLLIETVSGTGTTLFFFGLYGTQCLAGARNVIPRTRPQTQSPDAQSMNYPNQNYNSTITGPGIDGSIQIVP